MKDVQAVYDIKDSGARMKFDSGMVRDTQTGKTLYSLVFDGPMFKRWALHLTKGAVKYEARNWMKAAGDEELQRFRESALRHFIDWFDGKTDEDHAAGVFFNINGAEYVKEKMTKLIRKGPELRSCSPKGRYVESCVDCRRLNVSGADMETQVRGR